MEYGLKVTKKQLDELDKYPEINWYPWDLEDETEICFDTEEEREKAYQIIKNIK